MSRKAYQKFKNGEPLTRKEAMGAQCFSCNGESVELAHDCLGDSCPLYPWSPWGKKHGLRIVKPYRGIVRIKKKAKTEAVNVRA